MREMEAESVINRRVQKMSNSENNGKRGGVSQKHRPRRRMRDWKKTQAEREKVEIMWDRKNNGVGEGTNRESEREAGE